MSKEKSEIIQKFKKGVLLRDSAGRLTYEINERWHKHYRPAKKLISKKFGLFPFGMTINGPDESFQTFIKGRMRIGIEWDTWSGLIFVAKNQRSENLILDIAKYCEENKI